MTVNGVDRPKVGNALYGAYAQDFVCRDGERVIVVALTLRQWDNLEAATDTAAGMDALAARLGADLRREGERYAHRHAVTEALKPFFDAHTADEVGRAFDAKSVTWGRYRTFRQAVEQDPDCSLDNPMFSMLDHPGIGAYLTPGNPIAFSDVERIAPERAPALGENTDEILGGIGYADAEIARLHDDRIVAGPR